MCKERSVTDCAITGRNSCELFGDTVTKSCEDLHGAGAAGKEGPGRAGSVKAHHDLRQEK
jgi:hypothetical protein